ncbi:MAG TPA: hypothetical protein VJ019_01995 [Aestuariivirga sp.]|jgi:hypothetical protein|nr:hypothetical protein [Aestuariivirga sp.]
MLDLFKEAQWDELFAFFAKGNPPLMAQLLALNTIVFMIFMVRRMRGARTLNAETASMVQSMLLVANMLAIFQDNILNSLEWLL